MDYHLDNENLNLNERNKKLFTDLTKDYQIPENLSENVDTFKMYSDFMKEKDGLIEVINKIVNFGLNLCDASLSSEIMKLNKIVINYKNRIIMILENYQEQPGLLDPILPLIVPLIMNSSITLIEFYLKNQHTPNEDL
jgi:hypothetical protein